MPNVIEQQSKSNTNDKFGIVVSKFNGEITEKLLDGCLKTLISNGANTKNIDIVKVPGAFEIPTCAKNLIDFKKYNAIICIGCVIRGETTHYDHICTSVSNEIAYLGVLSSMPVIFGILTCENEEQALARAGGKEGNKGSDAATSAIEMITVLRNLKAKYDQELVADKMVL